MSNYRFHSPHIVKPWSNVDGRYVNVGATNNPAHFGSNETSREFGLSGIINNAKAAAASVLGMKGGSRSKKSRAKKNKISRKYTMATKKRSLLRRGKSLFMKMAKSVKRRFSRGKSRRGKSGRGKRGGARQPPIKGGNPYIKPMIGGGYLQYGSNAAANASYSTGGPLSPKDLGLANPSPFSASGGNCPNAYRH